MTVFIITENEESVPSEESNKSKSSQEEKNAQAQRRKGNDSTVLSKTHPAVKIRITTAPITWFVNLSMD